MDPDFNRELQGNYWDAYIRFTKLLLQTNLIEGENVFVVADFMTKPNSSNMNFQDEIMFNTESKGSICNVMMVDSIGIPLIQVCDLFLGAVMFENKLKQGFINADSRNSIARKVFVSKLVSEVLNAVDPNLDIFTINKSLNSFNKYFSVQHFKFKN